VAGRGALGGALRAGILGLCGIVAWKLALANQPFLERRGEEGANPHLVIAHEVARQTRGADGQGRAGDLLLIAGTGHYAHLETYIPYFAQRNLLTLAHALKHHGPGTGLTRADALQWLEERVQRSWSRGAEVYLFPDVLGDPAAFRSLTERYGLIPSEAHAFLQRFPREYAFTARGQPIYRLRRPPFEVPPVVADSEPEPDARPAPTAAAGTAGETTDGPA
jgi:hypothetical protein